MRETQEVQRLFFAILERPLAEGVFSRAAEILPITNLSFKPRAGCDGLGLPMNGHASKRRPGLGRAGAGGLAPSLPASSLSLLPYCKVICHGDFTLEDNWVLSEVVLFKGSGLFSLCRY